MNLLDEITIRAHMYAHRNGEFPELMLVSDNLMREFKEQCYLGDFRNIRITDILNTPRGFKLCGYDIGTIYDIDDLIVPIRKNEFPSLKREAACPALPGETSGVQDGRAKGGKL